MAVPHQAGRGLKVHLDGEEIVVWQRGMVFLIAFKKAPRQPRLIVTRNWLPTSPPNLLPSSERERLSSRSTRPGRLAGELLSPWRASASGQAWWRATFRAVSPRDRRGVARPSCGIVALSRAAGCVHDNLTTQTLPYEWRCSPCRAAGKLAKRERSSLDGICANDPHRCSCRISCRVGFLRPRGR